MRNFSPVLVRGAPCISRVIQPWRCGSHTAQTITTQIDNALLQDHALDIFNTAINSVLPQSMVAKALKLNGDRLTVGDQTYELHGNVYVVAFGKAVIGMVRAAEDVLGDHIAEGIASVPVGIQEDLRRLGKWWVNDSPCTCVPLGKENGW